MNVMKNTNITPKTLKYVTLSSFFFGIRSKR